MSEEIVSDLMRAHIYKLGNSDVLVVMLFYTGEGYRVST